MDNPNVSKDYWKADDESVVVLQNGIDDQESPEHQGVNAIANVSGLVWPTWRLQKKAEKGLMTGKAIHTQWNKEYKIK